MPNEPAIAAFRIQVRGKLIKPTDAEFETARLVYKRMIQRRPRLIAYGLGSDA